MTLRTFKCISHPCVRNFFNSLAQFLVTLALDAPATEQRSDKNKPTFRHFALKLYRKFDSTNENFLRDKNRNKNGNNNNLARFILDLYIYSRR